MDASNLIPQVSTVNSRNGSEANVSFLDGGDVESSSPLAGTHFTNMCDEENMATSSQEQNAGPSLKNDEGHEVTSLNDDKGIDAPSFGYQG